MASKKYVIAKQLGGKKVITNKGEEIGRLSDVTIEEKSGELDSMIVEADSGSSIARDLTGSDNMARVPFKAVFSVSDVIVVDETMLV